MNERMTDRITERLSGLTFVLCCYAMSVWVLAAVPVNYTVSAISAPVLPAAVFVCAVYLADSVMISRGFRLDFMVVFNVLCAAAGALADWYLTAFDPQMPAVRITFAVVYAVCVIIAWYVAAFPVKPSTVIGCFDWMAVLLVLHIVFRQLGVTLLTVKAPGVCAAAMACSLIAMIRIRLERTGASGATVGNAAAGQLLLGGIIAAIVILAVLLTAALSGTLHGLSELLLSALTAAGSVLLAAVGMLYHLLELFVRWLASWFRMDVELEGIESTTETSYESDTAAAAGAGVPLWFYVLLAAAAIVLIIRFFRRIRGIRMEGHNVSAAGAGERRGTLGAVLRLWRDLLCEKIRFAVRYRRGRSTPAGMLIWCEWHYHRVCPRQVSESAGAYLRRLAAYLEEQMADDAGTSAGTADVSAALRELADLIERAFYAPPACAAAGERYPALLRRLQK